MTINSRTQLLRALRGPCQHEGAVVISDRVWRWMFRNRSALQHRYLEKWGLQRPFPLGL